MSLLAPRDSRLVKKSPQEVFNNYFDVLDVSSVNMNVLNVSEINVDSLNVNLIDASGGITFGEETLNDYQEFSFGTTFSGAVLAPFNATGLITKIGRLVQLEILPTSPTVYLTDSVANIVSTADIPVDCRPSDTISSQDRAVVGGVDQLIGVSVASTGIITLTRGAVSGTALTFTTFASGSSFTTTDRISLSWSV